MLSHVMVEQPSSMAQDIDSRHLQDYMGIQDRVSA